MEQIKHAVNSWLDQPVSRRDAPIAILSALAIAVAGGYALLRERDLPISQSPAHQPFTHEDEQYVVGLLQHSNWWIQHLLNPTLVNLYQIGVPVEYSGVDVSDLKFRITNARQTGRENLKSVATSMNINGIRHNSGIIYSYFDGNAEVFLSKIDFSTSFLEIPELSNFQLPPSEIGGYRFIDPQFYKEAATAILNIPSSSEWEELADSRFEALYNIDDIYPVRVRPDWTGLPKIEVAFNQRGIDYSNSRKGDKYYFQ